MWNQTTVYSIITKTHENLIKQTGTKGPKKVRWLKKRLTSYVNLWQFCGGANRGQCPFKIGLQPPLVSSYVIKNVKKFPNIKNYTRAQLLQKSV